MVSTAKIHSILIVEDNQDLVMGLQDLLHHDGYAVTAAGTIATALKLVRAHRFNAILLDLGLPDGDGLEVLKESQRLDPSLPVVIVTAHISTDRTVGSLAQGPMPISRSRTIGKNFGTYSVAPSGSMNSQSKSNERNASSAKAKNGWSLRPKGLMTASGMDGCSPTNRGILHAHRCGGLLASRPCWGIPMRNFPMSWRAGRLAFTLRIAIAYLRL